MKKLAKRLVVSVLDRQIHRLQKRNNFKTVAVVGSIGKTSTKLAIAKVLAGKYRVRHQEGNYNDRVTVPLIFFGQSLPSLLNPLAWTILFIKNELQLLRPYPYDVVVTELGTDGPGQLKDFKKYRKFDVGVLTAIAPEHMQFFKDLDSVAREELTIVELAGTIVFNKDLIADKYTKDTKGTTYAIKEPADLQIKNLRFEGFECSFEVFYQGKLLFPAKHEPVAEPQLYSAAAAIAVGLELGMSPAEIEKGLHSIKPVSGRMQRLSGIKDSTIIDDTYNASPQATKAALDTLYRLSAPQRIAILGNMNELGAYSKSAHKNIGEYCNPQKLDLVITIGPDANEHLAAAAETNGCEVHRFDSPFKAGEFLGQKIQHGALILAKGSQNKVFAEEAVKLILANRADADKLVRQSPRWLKRKRKFF